MQPRLDLHPGQADRAESLDEPLSKAEGSSDTLAVSAPLSTALLLAGRNAVSIEHQGVNYVLRATRSGKLILTK